MKLLPFLLSISPMAAQTVFTVPQGYTKITIAGATVDGPSLSAISATLLRDTEYSGTINIGAFTANTDPTSDTQTLTAPSGTPWTSINYAADPDISYLAYLEDLQGGEQAFLISGNNASSLTIEVPNDLLANVGGSPRFPASTTLKIRKANTLLSIFGTGSSELNANDLIYLWDGSSWSSFFYSTSQSRFKVPGGGLSSNANSTVVYPDEGIFVSRTITTPIVLTLFGEVPTVPQVSTISGQGFMSCRVPVDTTLVGLGIATQSWTANDNVYIWNGQAWDSYTYSTSQSRWKAPGGGLSSNANDTPVTANSAVFVSRTIAIQPEDSAIPTQLPYTIGQ